MAAARKPEPPLPPSDRALLAAAAGGNDDLFAELAARVTAGEPAAYVAGFLIFRGRQFHIDSRAYVTDPELTHLVDVVAEEGAALARSLGRSPRLLEFGAGAGTLAISLKLEHPGWTVEGLDIDPDALEVARENAREKGANIAFYVSDYLDGRTDGDGAPDIIFADPPWGGVADLYADERSAEYYRRMPAKSAIPPGSDPCSIHNELIRRVRSRRWPSRLVLNYGVLPAFVVARSASALEKFRLIHPEPRLTILVGTG